MIHILQIFPRLQSNRTFFRDMLRYSPSQKLIQTCNVTPNEGCVHKCAKVRHEMYSGAHFTSKIFKKQVFN